MKKENEINFNNETHTYSMNGIIYPSVTQILQNSGLINIYGIDKEQLNIAQKFGNAVHKMIELYDKEILDIKKLDPRLKPYLNGYKKFKEYYNIDIIETELRLISKKYMYAGTIDKVVKLNDKIIIIDFKTGAIMPYHALQLVAYTQLYKENKKIKCSIERMCVKIEENDYKIKKFKEKGDFNIFLSALNISNWKKLKKMS